MHGDGDGGGRGGCPTPCKRERELSGRGNVRGTCRAECVQGERPDPGTLLRCVIVFMEAAHYVEK